MSRFDATDGDVAQRIGTLRSGLQATQFEIEKAENNADYLDRFLENPIAISAIVQIAARADKMPSLPIEGFNLTCTPHFLFTRVNRNNVSKIGLGFLRYARGKPLPVETACWQGAIAFGYLKAKLEQGLGDKDPETALCVTFDVWTAAAYPAPTNSVYRFKEVKAVCAGIAQRWDAIPPPSGAIF